MQNITEPTHSEIAELLIDERVSDMTQYLMDDYGYTLEESLDKVYHSHTIILLQLKEAELFVQSSAYVYELLIKELGLYPTFDSNGDGMVAEE